MSGRASASKTVSHYAKRIVQVVSPEQRNQSVSEQPHASHIRVVDGV